MRNKEQIITALSDFKNRDKFSYGALQERGLNRSDADTCVRLESLFNNCSDELTAAIEADVSSNKLITILKNNMNNVRQSGYDTEERELICDYFYELSRILSVDIKNYLNSWLYGNLLGTLLMITGFLRGTGKIVETLEQQCTNCDTSLRTLILKKKEGVPDHCWIIIRCNSCAEYNLLSVGPDVGEYKFENYEAVEQLPKAEYNEEQAIIRLEQIKFFRRK